MFVWRNDSSIDPCQNVKIDNYHDRRLVWLVPQIEAQCSMVGFVVDILPLGSIQGNTVFVTKNYYAWSRVHYYMYVVTRAYLHVLRVLPQVALQVLCTCATALAVYTRTSC